MLNRPGDPRKYEVLNLGVGGLNLRWSLERLRTVGLQFEPDLIVYGFTANDIEGESYRRSRDKGGLKWVTPSKLVNLLGQQWDYVRDVFWPTKGSYTWELQDNYFHNPEALNDWRSDLAKFAQMAANNHVCAAMLVHTELLGLHGLHPFSGFYEIARKEAAAQKIPVFDSFPYFEGRHAEELWVDYFDHHPNPEGHRILLQALIDGLSGLPPTCWEGTVPLALHEEQAAGSL